MMPTAEQPSAQSAAAPGDARCSPADHLARADVASATAQLSAADVAARLDLEPLPHEGGWFRRTFADTNVSTILYLLAAGDGFSAMHRLDGPEIYTFAAGAPAELLLLDTTGEGGAGARTVRLGADLAAGELPQAIVAGGVWQGGITLGAWSLVSATMAPPYTDDRFELADRAELISRWPAAADAIIARTR